MEDEVEHQDTVQGLEGGLDPSKGMGDLHILRGSLSVEPQPSDDPADNDSSTSTAGGGKSETSMKVKTDIERIVNQFQDTALEHTDDLGSSDDFVDPHQASYNHPKRTSSLASMSQAKSPSPTTNYVPHKTELSVTRVTGDKMSPVASPAINKSLPPAPDPEPDLPFDFHRFLDQLRHRTADPVAKFLRSFLSEFGKKQWMVHEQTKIISDFLSFITVKMQYCEVWREVSDAEFDNAKEGMEKLVMNRLYTQTFSPAIPPQPSTSPSTSKRRPVDKNAAPGRRGQHQEDIERDEILAQKVRIYGWIREEHLDIGSVGDSGKRFLSLAQQELLKIGSYRAPRDKVICVLNCCKVIFGFLRNTTSSDTSADSFIPLLIYVVLQASPDHLVSNVQYILRFRSQDKLGGEAGYYLSSLMGAIQFIENLDRTSLTVSDAEFEQNVEVAVSAIAEREKSTNVPPRLAGVGNIQDKLPSNDLEKDLSISTGRPSKHSPLGAGSSYQEAPEERAAVGTILRSIQKPLSSIGRMFSEDTPSYQHKADLQQIASGTTGPERRLSPAVFQPPHRNKQHEDPIDAPMRHATPQSNDSHTVEIRNRAAETSDRGDEGADHRDIIDTLTNMFPNLDRDVIVDVVRLKEGRVGSAVDACLALNT